MTNIMSSFCPTHFAYFSPTDDNHHALCQQRMSCREALAHLRLLLKQHVNTMMSLLTVMSMDSVELGVLLKRLNQRAAGIYGALTTVKDDEPVPPQLLETVRDFTLSGRTRSSALAFLFSAL